MEILILAIKYSDLLQNHANNNKSNFIVYHSLILKLINTMGRSLELFSENDLWKFRKYAIYISSSVWRRILWCFKQYFWTRMHSSRMRTACSYPVVSHWGNLKTPLDAYPTGCRPPLGRSPPECRPPECRAPPPDADPLGRTPPRGQKE